jgi:hypothetical protein
MAGGSSCGVLALEHWDINRPMARMVISLPQGHPQQPDHPNWSWHEYGMRVGFWRIRKMFDRLGVRPTVTLNARTCETYPEVIKACGSRSPFRRCAKCWRAAAAAGVNLRRMPDRT